MGYVYAYTCGIICVWLFQYCEYYPEYEKCKLWLERNMPTEFERIVKLGKYVYLPETFLVAGGVFEL
jgi:hypothetical protein